MRSDKKFIAVPYYHDDDPIRREEIHDAIRKNISLVGVEIILVCDSDGDGLKANEEFGTEVEVVNVGKRQTYSNMMGVIDKRNPDGINIISNADIFWTQRSLDLLDRVDWSRYILCLTRWEKEKSDLEIRKGKDSQDSWVYHAHYFKEVEGFDIQLGKAGCDNRVAHELSKKKEVINPSMSIVTGHIHTSEKRNYDPQDRMDPPYKLIDTTYLGEHEVKNVGRGAVVAPLIGMNDQREMVWAFEDHYDTVKVLNWKAMGVGTFNLELQRVDREYSPELTFLHIQTPDIIDPDVVRDLRCKVYNWTGDVRDGVPDWYEKVGPHMTATLFTNMDDVHEMRSRGMQGDHLQIGFNDDVFKPEGPRAYCPDVVFMGNDYGNRFPLGEFRRVMSYMLRAKYGGEFGLYGSNWKIEHTNLNGDVESEAAVYRGCKVAINCSHYDREQYSSDRIFRIMGSGALCLTRYYEGIEEDLTIGEHLDVFIGYDDLLEKVEYYLNNPMKRGMMARKGCYHVHARHNWGERLKRLDSLKPDGKGGLYMYNVPVTKDDDGKKNEGGGAMDPERSDMVIDEWHTNMSHSYQARTMKHMLATGYGKDKKLSILIPTIYSRRKEFETIYKELRRQMEEYSLNDDVEIVHDQDGGYWPIGAKRNKLIMECNGSHIMFVDDDDELKPWTLKRIMDNWEEDINCITFDMRVDMLDDDDEVDNTFIMNFDLEHKQRSNENGVLKSPPGHINVIRRDIALMHPFNVYGIPGKNRKERGDSGSDVHFCLDMVDHGSIKDQNRIDEVLYIYKRKEAKTDGTE